MPMCSLFNQFAQAGRADPNQSFAGFPVDLEELLLNVLNPSVYNINLKDNLNEACGSSSKDTTNKSGVSPVDLGELLRNLVVPNASTSNTNKNCGSSASDTKIKSDRNNYIVNLDVQQFKPEEITVKLTSDNIVTVEAKHEEKQDKHGFISRHFVRRYIVPENCDMDKLQSKLSPEGILSIIAPKIKSQLNEEWRDIPITRSGVATEMKKNEEKQENKNLEVESNEKVEEKQEKLVAE